MYFEINILSYLMESPHYGYEIKKKLTESVGACTTISNNTLYPILRKYEKMGAATKSVERTEGGQERIIYTLTDIGRKAFVDLLWYFPDSLMNNREEFCTRLSFFPYLNKEVRMRVLYLREQFIQNARNKVRQSHELYDSLRPHTQKLLDFHTGIMQGEEELIRYFRDKVDDPCILTERS
ncbi:MAG: PadR family transcriptional regulator [Clostridiales bacterium]|jgi:DNA-binding PadR family transcriptional regulator|nr:PadR family transcriptional regulator [Clostridiales bacterium]